MSKSNSNHKQKRARAASARPRNGLRQPSALLYDSYILSVLERGADGLAGQRVHPGEFLEALRVLRRESAHSARRESAPHKHSEDHGENFEVCTRAYAHARVRGRRPTLAASRIPPPLEPARAAPLRPNAEFARDPCGSRLGPVASRSGVAEDDDGGRDGNNSIGKRSKRRANPRPAIRQQYLPGGGQRRLRMHPRR